MKVFLIFEFPVLNGGERSLLTVLPDLQQKGAEFVALAPESGPLAAGLQALGIRVDPLETISGPERQHRMRLNLEAGLRRHEPELIHANSLAIARLVGPVARKLGVPSVGHLRDIMRLSRQSCVDLSANNRLIAVSHAVRQHHLELGVPADRIVTIHNGIDLEEFSVRQPTGYLHRELCVPSDWQLLMGIGQIGMRKGWEVVLQALHKVFEQRDNVCFVHIGDQTSQKAEADAYARDLRQTARKGPLAGNVHFLGRRDDVPDALGEASLLLHPAHQEPLGRVLLEASALGVPVVATDVGGTKEIYPSWESGGIVVPKGGAVEMAAAVVQLLADDSLRQQIGQNGRGRIASSFSRACCSEATWSLYEQVAAEKQPPDWEV